MPVKNPIKGSFFILVFGNVTQVYKNFVELTSVCPADKKLARLVYSSHYVYTPSGVFIGSVAGYYLGRKFLVFLENDNIIPVLGDVFCFIKDNKYLPLYKESQGNKDIYIFNPYLERSLNKHEKNELYMKEYLNKSF